MSYNIDKDVIPEEEMNKINERVEKQMENLDLSMELVRSMDRIPGQNFAIVAFAGEGCRPLSKQLGIKIWGCKNTIEEATEFASYIAKMQENRNYNIYIQETGNWAIMPPKIDKLNDTKYQEEQLNSIFQEHHKQGILAKEVFDTRKHLLMMENEKANERVMEDIKKNKEATIEEV